MGSALLRLTRCSIPQLHTTHPLHTLHNHVKIGQSNTTEVAQRCSARSGSKWSARAESQLSCASNCRSTCRDRHSTSRSYVRSTPLLPYLTLANLHHSLAQLSAPAPHTPPTIHIHIRKVDQTKSSPPLRPLCNMRPLCNTHTLCNTRRLTQPWWIPPRRRSWMDMTRALHRSTLQHLRCCTCSVTRPCTVVAERRSIPICSHCIWQRSHHYGPIALYLSESCRA